MTMAQRAKTKDEKKQIITRLYKLWLKNPELRLSQLIENTYHHKNDNHCLYFVEDFDLIEALERHYQESDEKLTN
jgi:predicted Rossmann-fold nucleotide-binding protein